MPVDMITRIEEHTKSMTYNGVDIGQEYDEHEPEIAGVMMSMMRLLK